MAGGARRAYPIGMRYPMATVAVLLLTSAALAADSVSTGGNATSGPAPANPSANTGTIRPSAYTGAINPSAGGSTGASNPSANAGAINPSQNGPFAVPAAAGTTVSGVGPSFGAGTTTVDQRSTALVRNAILNAKPPAGAASLTVKNMLVVTSAGKVYVSGLVGGEAEQAAVIRAAAAVVGAGNVVDELRIDPTLRTAAP